MRMDVEHSLLSLAVNFVLRIKGIFLRSLMVNGFSFAESINNMCYDEHVYHR